MFPRFKCHKASDETFNYHSRSSKLKRLYLESGGRNNYCKKDKDGLRVAGAGGPAPRPESAVLPKREGGIKRQIRSEKRTKGSTLFQIWTKKAQKHQ